MLIGSEEWFNEGGTGQRHSAWIIPMLENVLKDLIAFLSDLILVFILIMHRNTAIYP